MASVCHCAYKQAFIHSLGTTVTESKQNPISYLNSYIASKSEVPIVFSADDRGHH